MEDMFDLKDLTYEDMQDNAKIIEQSNRVRMHIGSAIATIDLVQHVDEESKKKYEFIPDLIEQLRKYALVLNLRRMWQATEDEKQQLWQGAQKYQESIKPLLKRVKKVESN